jgi:hypothetical protein
LVVLDFANFRIQKFNQNGKFMGWLGGTQWNRGSSHWNLEGMALPGHLEGMFFRPLDVFMDSEFLLVAEPDLYRISIFDLKSLEISNS